MNTEEEYKKKIDGLERHNGLLKILCSYLLLERKQETQLRMAFSMLVQERHNEFHTVGGRKNGEQVDGEQLPFSDCSNEICQAAFDVIKNERAMAIEVNDLTIGMLSNYDLSITGSKTSCRAFLKPKNQIQTSQIVTP